MTSQKYHVNAKGKTVPCHATVRACRYSEHTVVDATSAATFLDNVDKGVVRSPATIRKNILSEPKVWLLDSGFDFGDDPYYFEPGDYLSTEITAVDIRLLLTNIHNAYDPQLITDDYIEYALSHNWANPENFTVERNWGYYDEIDSKIRLTDSFFAEVQELYWKNDNAHDLAGVLEYVRGKGFATAGLSPVEAIKKQLKDENGGKDHPRVDSATKVRVKNLKLDKIKIAAPQHYSRVEPSLLTPPNPEGKKIAGVVVETAPGVYSLVDGYHRLKGLNNNNRKSGQYIILS